MSRKTEIGKMSEEISKILTQYTDEVRKGIDEIVPVVAKEGVKELKVSGGFQDHTKDYRKGWSYQITKSRLGVSAEIYNKQYYLTHLLEFGHATRNGGRTRAFPHIANVETEVVDSFAKKVEDLIK